jgi:plasmid stability protein
MAVITGRSLPEETARALQARAANSGGSTGAEVREILNAAVRTPAGLATALAALGKRVGAVEASPRCRSPALAGPQVVNSTPRGPGCAARNHAG